MLPDERARLPLALGPPLLAAALVRPAGLNPTEPLAFLPLDAWVLLLLAAATPAATVLTARALLKDRPERSRALVTGGIALAMGVAAVVAASIALADALVYREGGARILLASSLAALAIVAGALAVKPLHRALQGALAGELVIALLLRFLLGGPSTPAEELKQAMIVTPGWGKTSLASLAARRLSPASADELGAWDQKIARLIEEGGLERYADDARVVRGWLAIHRSSLDESQRSTLLRLAAQEQGLFAASPASSLEPFTTSGVLSIDVFGLTAGLDVEDDLRYRVYFAWTALDVFALSIDDEPAEREAIGVLRALFENNGLRRTHRLYLATIAIERRRLLLAGNGEAFAARMEALSKEEWPPDLAADFAEQAKFVRDHPEESYQPVMTLLRARMHAENGKVAPAEREYRKLLETWPSGPLAPTARLESAKLGKD